MKCKLLAFLFIALVLVSSALAANYQISIDPINNSIFPDQSGVFKLSITNFDRSSRRFQVYTTDPKWVVRVNPALTPVPSETLQVHTLLVKPKSTIGFGTEAVTINVKNLDTDIITQERLILDVRDPNRAGGEYAPSIKFDVILPSNNDPREPLDIVLTYRNRNALNISNLQVELSSDLFSKQYNTSLGPLKEKTEEHSFTIDPHQTSGEYPFFAKLTYKGVIINEVTKTLRIATIEDVREHSVDEGSLFKKVTRLTVTNNGNGPAKYEAKLATNWFRNLFTSTSPQTSMQKRAGQSYHVWELSLASQESVTLERVENYRLLIIIIILLIAGVITYYVTRSPIIAVKEAIAQREEGEEGSSSLKIRLFIKNRSGSPLSGVNVIDRVPSIAVYQPEDHLGTISPTKVVSSPKKGTVLKWELDLLEPYEERILSYRLASKLKIVGKMRLASSKVQFTTKAGKERLTYTKNMSYEE